MAEEGQRGFAGKHSVPHDFDKRAQTLYLQCCQIPCCSVTESAQSALYTWVGVKVFAKNSSENQSCIW